MKLAQIFSTAVITILLVGCTNSADHSEELAVQKELPVGEGFQEQDMPPAKNMPQGEKLPNPIENSKGEIPVDKGPNEAAKTVGGQSGVLDGPYWQNLVFSSSKDGTNWSEDQTVVEHASGPDVLVVSQDIGPYSKGDIILIFTYFYENKVGSDYLAFMHSSDNGSTWSEPTEIEIEGSDHLPVDPAIYQMDDGELLIIYQDLKTSNDQSDEHNFYIASSDDGENFSYSGEIFSEEEFFIHPDLVYFDNQWLLYYAADWGNRKIWVSKSDDYREFEKGEELGFEGMPGTMVNGDNLEIYGCDKEKGLTLVTTSDAISYSEASATGLRGCAPSPFIMPDGKTGMIKTKSSK